MQLDRRQFLQASYSAIAASAAHGIKLSKIFKASSPHTLAHDPRRPQYHLLPPANWMNDPNAPTYWKGKYHMFYQYNPNGAIWGDMHWGHAISPDMVHWQHLPVALAPTAGGPDAEGCFSGSAVIDGEHLSVLYTGIVSAPENQATSHSGIHHWRESQCLATALNDDLTEWRKYSRSVIAAPPSGMNVRGFRDPCPWLQSGTWYLVLGSGITGVGGTVLLYRSKDIHHWEYIHELYRGSVSASSSSPDSGKMWECPDFFPLGERHVLIHSTQGRAYWQCGTFDLDELVFRPETGGLLDYGSFYAPKTQLDRSGNRILWGWITETRPEAEYKAAGWAGAMSLPRILTLDQNNNLQFKMAPAVDELRQAQQRLLITDDEEKNRHQIARLKVKNCCGDITVAFRPALGPINISLSSDQYGEPPLLTCTYDPSIPNAIKIDSDTISFHISRNADLEFRFLIDGSIIECFAGKNVAYTKRFYYECSFAPEIGIEITGKTTILSSLTMCQLSPISPDRMTS